MATEMAGASADNEPMLAAESQRKRFHGPSLDLAGTPEIRGKPRVRLLPFAITLLYALEQVVAAFCLICLSPFLAILAAAICLASRASPLVAHRRVGLHGETLWVYKFRTMWSRDMSRRQSALFIERVADDEPRLKVGPDPRVTNRFAFFCRRHSIDELPQLALVAAGRMSLVGPRPITRFELHEYYDSEVMEFLSLKPGLTGLWQIRGRSRLNYRQRKRFDLFLVRHFSVGFYFRIVARTIPHLLFPRDAW